MLHVAGEEILACQTEQKDNICCHCTASKLGNLTTANISRSVTTELSSNIRVELSGDFDYAKSKI